MNQQSSAKANDGQTVSRSGMMDPLRETAFRRIWTTSLLSNLGQQMQAVAAAWTMLQITHQANLVAMVQTASMLPVMLLAIAAGALADMYDRRRVALAALMLSVSGAALLAGVAFAGVITPKLILLGVFITGTGIALYSPAWQASAAEIVGVKAMPAAVALYSLSSNAARSVGPALGGIMIASAGMVAAFSLNAALYIPIIIALLLWKRKPLTPRFPPERLDRAMLAGLRYVHHSPPVRRVIVRSISIAVGGAAIYSMLPLVAQNTLGGGPGTYGILLGAFGFGAVKLCAHHQQSARPVFSRTYHRHLFAGLGHRNHHRGVQPVHRLDRIGDGCRWRRVDGFDFDLQRIGAAQFAALGQRSGAGHFSGGGFRRAGRRRAALGEFGGALWRRQGAASGRLIRAFDGAFRTAARNARNRGSRGPRLRRAAIPSYKWR